MGYQGCGWAVSGVNPCVFNEAAGDILLNLSSTVVRRRGEYLNYRKTIQYKCEKCDQVHTRHRFLWAKQEHSA